MEEGAEETYALLAEHRLDRTGLEVKLDRGFEAGTYGVTIEFDELARRVGFSKARRTAGKYCSLLKNQLGRLPGHSLGETEDASRTELPFFAGRVSPTSRWSLPFPTRIPMRPRYHHSSRRGRSCETEFANVRSQTPFGNEETRSNPISGQGYTELSIPPATGCRERVPETRLPFGPEPNGRALRDPRLELSYPNCLRSAGSHRP
jgi:hypothetical protein